MVRVLRIQQRVSVAVRSVTQQSLNFEVHVSYPANPPPLILCVDDRVASLEVRRTLLTTVGYDVLIASDPPSALAITDKVEVDLVILDYNFPGHMCGEELARKLRAANPNCRSSNAVGSARPARQRSGKRGYVDHERRPPARPIRRRRSSACCRASFQP